MIDLLNEEIEKIYNSSEIKTFGIILYTEENPNIVKLLRDEDNWNALDSISGEKFNIFAIKPKKGEMSFPKESNTNLMMLLTPIWKEPSANKDLLEVFEIPSTEKLPIFIVFTKYKDTYTEALYKKEFKLNEVSVDIALEQLRKIFYDIRKISNKINTKEEHEIVIYEHFEKILKKHNFKKNLLEMEALFKRIKSFIPFNKILF